MRKLFLSIITCLILFISTNSFAFIEFKQTKNISSDTEQARGINFNLDGTIMYITNRKAASGAEGQKGQVTQYSLSTPYDISTAEKTSQTDLLGSDVSSVLKYPHAIEFKPDGTKMFVTAGDAVASVYQYNLTTPWDIKISNALYSALMTDTGSFRYNNTTSECHDMASELIDFGVKPYDMYVPIYEQRSFSQLRLFSYVVNNLKFSLNNKVCYVIIDKDTFKNTDSKVEDVDGFTEFLRSIKDVEVSFLITQQSDDIYRVSFRSKGKYSINDTAGEFGGGGHAFAAGAKISDSNILDIEEKILNLLKQKMV